MVTTAITNLLIAYFWISSDADNGLIGDCLLYDDKGTQIISSTNILMFGIVNAFFTADAAFLHHAFFR